MGMQVCVCLQSCFVCWRAALCTCCGDRASANRNKDWREVWVTQLCCGWLRYDSFCYLSLSLTHTHKESWWLNRIRCLIMPVILFHWFSSFPFFPSSHLTHLFSSFLLQIFFSHLSSLLLLHLLHYLLFFPIFFYTSLLFSPVLSSLLSFFFAPLSFHCLLLPSPAFLSFSPSALFPSRPSFKLLCLPFLSPRSSDSIFLYLISICSLLFCLSSAVLLLLSFFPFQLFQILSFSLLLCLSFSHPFIYFPPLCTSPSPPSLLCWTSTGEDQPDQHKNTN